MAEVMDYIQGRGVIFTVIPHRATSAPTAEIGSWGISEDEAVKTVVVIANYGPALMVIPESRELDLQLVAKATKDPLVRLATDRELQRAFPDYEPGALPPMSMLLLVPMYVDPTVLERDQVVFAAGRHDVSIRMATQDLFGTDPVVIVPLTAESDLEAAPAGG
jgi:Ala-tRNA(Pro) deacylase